MSDITTPETEKKDGILERVTNALSFKTSDNEDPVEPDAVVTPSIPVVTPSIPIVTPSIPIVTPSIPIVTPSIPVVTPSIPIVTPSIPIVTPSIPVVTPSPSLIPYETFTQEPFMTSDSEEISDNMGYVPAFAPLDAPSNNTKKKRRRKKCKCPTKKQNKLTKKRPRCKRGRRNKTTKRCESKKKCAKGSRVEPKTGVCTSK